MTITVNGEVREIESGLQVAELLRSLSLPDKRVAVELNGNVVSRGEWALTDITQGDRLEIVHFVGGG